MPRLFVLLRWPWRPLLLLLLHLLLPHLHLRLRLLLLAPLLLLLPLPLLLHLLQLLWLLLQRKHQRSLYNPLHLAHSTLMAYNRSVWFKGLMGRSSLRFWIHH